MPIHVEFFGIPRQRAGTSCIDVDASSHGLTLGELLSRLERQFPGLKGDCIGGGRMQPGYVANLDGEHFVSDPMSMVKAGQSVLIMSADAGG